MEAAEVFKVLSNKARLQLLEWLKDPKGNFPEQACYGYKNGVCVGQLQAKSGLSQSTVSEYMASLERAGFVSSVKAGQWTYYKRNETAFRALCTIIKTTL